MHCGRRTSGDALRMPDELNCSRLDGNGEYQQGSRQPVQLRIDRAKSKGLRGPTAVPKHGRHTAHANTKASVSGVHKAATGALRMHGEAHAATARGQTSQPGAT